MIKIHVNKKRWYFALLNCVLVLLALICLLVFRHIAGTLDSVHAADRWRGGSEMRFAQVACFLPVDSPKTQDDILQFRRTLDQKLVAASLEAPEGGSLYTDAYSGSAKLTVSGDHGSAEVKAIGVGGNFFLFHPLQLRSGSYLSETDLMQDRVILDEALAWQLFGSPDVSGMTVTIGGNPYYVAGVIRRENDFATKEAYLDGAGMFISYSAFQALTQPSSDTETASATGSITCYEIVLPDMIDGFGKSLVKDNFDVGTGDIVENSSRYSVSNLLSIAKDYGLRSMRNNGVIYPYWENAVRLTEDYLALLLVLIMLFALFPVITCIVLAIRTIIQVYRRERARVPKEIDALIEKEREKKYAQSGEK